MKYINNYAEDDTVNDYNDNADIVMYILLYLAEIQ